MNSEIPKKIPAEELKKLLSMPIPTPDKAKKYLSGVRFDRIAQFCTAPTCVDLDTMANEIDKEDREELYEYVIQLPEWRNLSRDYQKAIDEGFNFLRQRIPSAVKKAFNVFTPFGAADIFDLYDVIGDINNSMSLSIPDSNIMTPCRNFLRMQFFIEMISRLTFEIIEEYNRLPRQVVPPNGTKETVDISKLLSDRFNVLTKTLEKANANLFPHGLPGLNCQTTVKIIRSTNEKYSKNLIELASEGGTTKNHQDLQKEIAEKHELIIDLMSEVKFDQFEYQGKGFKVLFLNLRDHLPPGSKGMHLFKCKIVLEPNSKATLEPNVTIDRGLASMTLNSEIGQYDLSVETAKDKLMFTVNGLPLDLLISNQTIALQITNAVHKFLLDHLLDLESKQPKSAPQIPTVSSVAKETINATEQVINPSIEGRDKEDWRQYIPVPTNKESSTETVIPDNEIPESGKKKVNISLFNRRGSRVLSTLTKLLGHPVRCEGTSHYIFRGRNGKTYPISIHSGEDIRPGLLRKCLSEYGISKEEFATEY